jgi:hypothetical protein
LERTPLAPDLKAFSWDSYSWFRPIIPCVIDTFPFQKYLFRRLELGSKGWNSLNTRQSKISVSPHDSIYVGSTGFGFISIACTNGIHYTLDSFVQRGNAFSLAMRLNHNHIQGRFSMNIKQCLVLSVLTGLSCATSLFASLPGGVDNNTKAPMSGLPYQVTADQAKKWLFGDDILEPSHNRSKCSFPNMPKDKLEANVRNLEKDLIDEVLMGDTRQILLNFVAKHSITSVGVQDREFLVEKMAQLTYSQAIEIVKNLHLIDAVHVLTSGRHEGVTLPQLLFFKTVDLLQLKDYCEKKAACEFNFSILGEIREQKKSWVLENTPVGCDSVESASAEEGAKEGYAVDKSKQLGALSQMSQKGHVTFAVDLDGQGVK